jgi:UDP-N-acetylglucosamine--N-acetylmuramyl-(pentapeptide) pyrophosphoryl-undecaprenol N-acetylglucosamine transferase
LKILFAGGGTGGHLMPALALARAVSALGHEVVMIGARRGIEADILPRHPFRFHLLPFEPIYRRTWWRNWRWPLLAWRLRREIKRLLGAERPSLVVGTGGYAAGPLVWYAQRNGIPTVLQEQNAFPGLATRLLAKRARQVHLGFPEARARLSPGPHTQVFDFGNPIEPPAAVDPGAARTAFALAAGRPTVLVFGGSQGARAINQAVDAALERGLLAGVNLLWGTGSAQEATYAARAERGHVVVRGFFDPIAPAYAAADLVVSRAGAITIAELCAWGKANVLIPLPTAAADHQTSNARALADAGASVLLLERDLTPESLATTITGLVRDRHRLEALSAVTRKRGHPNAARSIAAKVLALLQV